jgi:hypothetical protein
MVFGIFPLPFYSLMRLSLIINIQGDSSMKPFLILFSSLLSISAFAHVEPGVYLGHTAIGEECSMESLSQYFENGEAHPLNERVIIKVGTRTSY